MESKIPLPTDNIYKFYALFGLMLLITSFLAIVFVSNSTNEKLHNLVKEYEAIPGLDVEKEETPFAKFIEKRIEVEVENKEIFILGLGTSSGVAVLFIWYGFRQWHTKIQPKQDEFFDLQLQKLKQDIENNSDGQSTSN